MVLVYSKNILVVRFYYSFYFFTNPFPIMYLNNAQRGIARKTPSKMVYVLYPDGLHEMGTSSISVDRHNMIEIAEKLHQNVKDDPSIQNITKFSDYVKYWNYIYHDHVVYMLNRSVNPEKALSLYCDTDPSKVTIEETAWGYNICAILENYDNWKIELNLIIGTYLINDMGSISIKFSSTLDTSDVLYEIKRTKESLDMSYILENHLQLFNAVPFMTSKGKMIPDILSDEQIQSKATLKALNLVKKRHYENLRVALCNLGVKPSNLPTQRVVGNRIDLSNPKVIDFMDTFYKVRKIK